MYKHILFPTDGSELSEAAARQAVAFAKSISARLTGITVSRPFHTFALEAQIVTYTPEQYRKDCDASAEKYLGAVKKLANAAGVRYEAVHVVNDHPYQEIIKAAQEKGCDLIFMASHGRRGISGIVIGSETNKVLTHSKIPVLVCR
jgi:nucleotide-binding universal stress UspA family protein